MSVQNSPLYTIPAGAGFADSLARGILEETEGNPQTLSRYTILLPTRRACRTLRDSFLKLSEGRPLLLPHLQAIGDIDEEELTLELIGKGTADQTLDMPPAINPLHRQILLARTIMAMPEEDFSHGPEHAFALAGTLGRLIDQIHTEGLNTKDLLALVPDIHESFAAHWQITLKFLQIIIETWPTVLAEQGMMEIAERRNLLIRTLAAHWRDHPPQTPVIAAGSTGSIPATAELLAVIAELPQGRVVLPGLDQTLDEASWQAIEETHPQSTLRELLDHLAVSRQDVALWHGVKASPSLARALLATELMRPAATAHNWMTLKETFAVQGKEDVMATLAGIDRFDCDTAQEEANLIAVMLRETLETKGKTAAVITPDRELARRIATACQRWDITVDDSGGLPLPATAIGSFIFLSLRACISNLSPVALVSLFKHKFCHAGFDPAEFSALSQNFEKLYLRGPACAAGFEGLRQMAEGKKKGKDGDKKAVHFLDQLEPIMTSFVTLCTTPEKQDFIIFLDNHIKTMERLYKKASLDENDTIWSGENGEAAALFLSELRDLAPALPRVTAPQYEAILLQMMKAITVRPSYGTHPRLYILGQLEARLVKADLVILAGLNEGTWPPDPGHDPWMSRPMKKAFGLPSPERSIGLSAHDFIEGFCCPRVVLTRSKRVDGTPSVPARWLQRLDTVLQAFDINPQILTKPYYTALADSLDKQEKTESRTRPAPCPPRAKRPKDLYVTHIEKWMRDPYALYAQKILDLKKIRPLEEQADAAIRGTIVHDVFHHFIQDNKTSLPENALDILKEEGRRTLEEESIDRNSLDFWWPRFERMTTWFIGHEETWRHQAKPAATETTGQMTITTSKGTEFVLKAKADRIDTMNDGSLAIIDYKTGSPPSTTHVIGGFSPQLTLEAAIALDKKDGFPHVTADDIGYIGFWQLSGGTEAGKDIPVKSKDGTCLYDLAIQAQEGLARLIDHFDNDNTPYISLPRPDYAPPAAYQDYAHLARVAEWADLDDTGGDN